MRELYRLLARHRVGIRLLDCCSRDHPELAAVWYNAGREGVQQQLGRYLEDRVRRRRLEPIEEPAITARILIETAAFWAVHRHWDPAPQPIDEAAAERIVVEFVVRSLLGPHRGSRHAATR